MKSLGGSFSHSRSGASWRTNYLIYLVARAESNHRHKDFQSLPQITHIRLIYIINPDIHCGI